jgi:hypothetical protein
MANAAILLACFIIVGGILIGLLAKLAIRAIVIAFNFGFNLAFSIIGMMMKIGRPAHPIEKDCTHKAPVAIPIPPQGGANEDRHDAIVEILN